MQGHDIIVIGGSAGSVEALSAVLAGLPPDLPAAVCVVLHQSALSPNRRPEIFGRASALPVMLAEQGMRLKPGTVYLSVPDMHMLVEPGVNGSRNETGVIRLVRGPRENRSRPAIDPLFRTAALTFGSRVIGVILSGALDDGTSGLWVVKDRGGIAVVQDPADAAVQSMPTHAIEEVGADHIAPATAIGPLLARLVRLPATAEVNMHATDDQARGPHDADLEREVAIAAMDEAAHQESPRYGVPSRFACPDCGGVLWDTSRRGSPLQLRCETGHAYAGESLAESQTEAVEYALWAALRALEDKAELARLRAGLARERGIEAHALQFDVQLQAAQQHASAIRSLLRMDGRTGIRPRTDREIPTDANIEGDRSSSQAG
jgi:two-component system, chemotaxis family, protein-glutamate methylesterase/glutaminase